MSEFFSFLTPDNPIYQVMVGAALGAFVGLRREMDNQQRKKPVFMGFRTMTLMTTFGVISTLFDSMSYLPAVCFAGLTLFLAIAYTNGAFRINVIGLTSELSAIFMFWIGVLIGYEQAVLAIILTILVGSINAFKEELHNFAKTISPKEWIGALQLLMVSGAVLPFLPREAIDPLSILVPFNIWFLVILISGIGFIGYFLTKFIGIKNSVVLTAFLGSIVSSTAVTTSMSTQSKKTHLASIYTVGVLIAIATMQARVALVILALASSQLSREIVMVPITMALSAGLLAAYLFYKTQPNHTESKKARKHPDTNVNLQSPFEILPALKFGGIFILVLLGLALAQKYIGDSGVFLAAIFSGSVDVDAIVLSSIESSKLGEMPLGLAEKAILIGIIVNNLAKIFYVAVLGNKKMIVTVASSIIATSAVGLLVWWIW